MIVDAKELLGSGADYEEVLHRMRENGLNKIASIKALVVSTGMPLRDAKLLVHNSNAWQDVSRRDEDLHRQLDMVVEELQTGGRVSSQGESSRVDQ